MAKSPLYRVAILPGSSKFWPVAIAVLAGLLIGFAGTTIAYRYRLLRVPGQGVIERLNRELNLTPAQRNQIGEIMHATRSKVRQMREDFTHQRRQVFLQAYTQIRGILTPEQQQKFDREFPPPGAHPHEDGGHFHDGPEGPGL
ncbi:MAG TPA: Spy/CpxP family protein refolding chaperone [Candidatus Binataceae bacterium]